jgi:glyoxylase-like metal-dependent hydrolase (beta-lactamase superfamily II)
MRARLAIAFAMFAVNASSTAADLTPVKVSAHAYYVQGEAGSSSTANEGFNSNAGFVVTPEGVVVIDALGTPALGRALVKAIRTVTDQPIRRVIVTHYHADHFYGLSALKESGAEVWAHRGAMAYLNGGDAERRLQQRARELDPWVTEAMPLVRADLWLDGDTAFKLGGLRFEVLHVGPAHSPEDLVVTLPDEGTIFGGDIFFAGRLPFVGDADSQRWLAAMERLITLGPKVIVPGHGAASRDPTRDLALTRDYLTALRAAMGKAVEDFTPFEEAYAKADWSRFARLPAFEAANRANAYGTYLQMEKELLAR